MGQNQSGTFWQPHCRLFMEALLLLYHAQSLYGYPFSPFLSLSLSPGPAFFIHSLSLLFLPLGRLFFFSVGFGSSLCKPAQIEASAIYGTPIVRKREGRKTSRVEGYTTW